METRLMGAIEGCANCARAVDGCLDDGVLLGVDGSAIFQLFSREEPDALLAMG
jgi:hypothetical protein